MRNQVDLCVPGLGDAADIIDRAGASGLNCDGAGLDGARHRAYQTAFGESPSTILRRSPGTRILGTTFADSA